MVGVNKAREQEPTNQTAEADRSRANDWCEDAAVFSQVFGQLGVTALMGLEARAPSILLQVAEHADDTVSVLRSLFRPRVKPDVMGVGCDGGI